MGFERTGDWSKVRFLIGQIDEECMKAKMLSLKRWGLKAEAIAKTHISKQDLNWEILNPEYLAKKIRQGHSENILVATSSYFNSITSYVLDDAAFAGVRKEAKDNSGNNIFDIAIVHEYGSKSGNIPARPLWQPTFQEVMIWHVKHNRPEIYLINSLKKYV